MHQKGSGGDRTVSQTQLEAYFSAIDNIVYAIEFGQKRAHRRELIALLVLLIYLLHEHLYCTYCHIIVYTTFLLIADANE